MFEITLNDVKSFLGYEQTDTSPAAYDTSRDAILTVLLNGALAILKKLLGRNLERGTYRDTLEYQPQRLYLHEWPIVSITSIERGGVPIDPASYEAFLSKGYIFFKRTVDRFSDETLFLKVVYIAGYETLPDDLFLAVMTAIQAADNANKQVGTQGGIIKRISVYDVGVTDYAIPKELNSLMRETLESLLTPQIERAQSLGAPLLHESELIS
jgi:hypothetical protein